ncbi:MAG: vitamin B12 dependent-methionine synthase activation domain-containing protein [Acidobacteriota bacterium]
MTNTDLHTVHFEVDSIPFDAETTRKYLRLGSSSEDKEALLEVCRGVYLKYRHVFSPALRYKTFKITEKDPLNSRIKFHEGSSFTGKGVFRLLRDCEMASLYLITLGEESDGVIQRLENEDFLDGYMLNAAASALIEAIQLKARYLILSQAEEKILHLTKRFSPGYRGWDLTEQGTLISMLKGSDIGVRLTETCLMLPMKSVSGVYGLMR